MDDAALRRGQPCVHRQFGEASALLAAQAERTLNSLARRRASLWAHLRAATELTTQTLAASDQILSAA